MPKDPSITILVPAEEKALMEDYCEKTGRKATEVLRAFIRSLVQELPYHYGLVSVRLDPLEFWMCDGQKLTEEEFYTQHPQAYRYWRQAQEYEKATTNRNRLIANC